MARATVRRIGLAALLIVASVATVAVEADARLGAHDLEVDAIAVPSTSDTAVTLTIDVELRNLGTLPWSAERGFALAYHWFDTTGAAVVWDGERSPLGTVIEPGQSRFVSATLRTPTRAGEYCLQWDVVQEGELWVSEVDPTPVACRPMTVLATHAFSLVEVDEPRIIPAGRERSATVVVRNDGRRPWPSDGSVSLAYHWFDLDGRVVEWEGRRTRVERTVPPGETIELRAPVAAPSVGGRFLLRWDMVDEGVCWFSDRDASQEPSAVVVVVPAALLGPRLLTLLVTLAAVGAVARSRRGGLSGGWTVADIGWCVGSVVVKQSWVLQDAGLDLTAAGWCFTIASAVLVGMIALAVPARLRPWFSWSVCALVTAVLFADLVHLRFFGDLGSLAAVRSAGQLVQVGDSVRSLLQPGDLWFGADLAPGLVLVVVLACSGSGRSGRARLLVGSSALAGLLTVCGLVTVADREALRQVFQTAQLARQVGVLNLHAADLGSTVLRGLARPELDEAGFEEVVGFFDHHRASRAGAGPFFGAARGRNLVMVQVESLQSFVVGLRIDGREVTPTLDALAAGSFWFAEVTDQTEEGRSSDAELATQVSLLAPDRGAAAFLYADNRFTGLASVLAERGYATLSAVPFDGAFWNRRVTHRAFGYQHSLFAEDFGPGDTVGWGLNDRDFLSQVSERLAELPEPWAAYLLTLSLHHPFDGFPEHLKRLDVGHWEGTPFGNFVHTMHHFDRALSDFLASLERTGLADTTVVAIWGDHDAGFDWRPEIAEVMGASHDALGWYLSQSVPLVIRVPGVQAPSEPLLVPAGHCDAAPTLLALLGVDPAPLPFVGRNLLGQPGPGPVVGEYRCWRDQSHVYLRRGPRLADGECIELETMARVAPASCASSFDDARRQVEISDLVLEHDLQRRIRAALSR